MPESTAFGSAVSNFLFMVLMFALGGGEIMSRNAPQRAPSQPAQPYVVANARSIDQTVRSLHAANKLQDLINAGGIGCRVYIQHESDVATNQAEVHDAADDVFLILEGTAIFVLGGKLDEPKETQPGEWRASDLSGGKEHKVAKGDLLIVPRGTPHRRITSGMDVTFMLIKSFTAAAK